MRSSTLIWIGLLSLAHPGCIAVAAGAAAGYGTSQIVRNADVRDHAGAFPVVWASTLASVREAGYPVALDAPAEPTMGSLAVNDLALGAWQVGEGVTRVRVRIGTFSTDAHRRLTARIHDAIAARVAP